MRYAYQCDRFASWYSIFLGSSYSGHAHHAHCSVHFAFNVKIAIFKICMKLLGRGNEPMGVFKF